MILGRGEGVLKGAEPRWIDLYLKRRRGSGGREKVGWRDKGQYGVSLDNLRWLVWERFVGGAGKCERCVCVCVYRKTEQTKRRAF